jgi:hypothetical protein
MISALCKRTSSMVSNIRTQSAEFHAVFVLALRFNELRTPTSAVDDRESEARKEYEAAVNSLIEAFRANGRLV